jgi:hypothetical protein
MQRHKFLGEAAKAPKINQLGGVRISIRGCLFTAVLDLIPTLKLLIGLLARQAANINSLGRLITLKSSLETVAIITEWV